MWKKSNPGYLKLKKKILLLKLYWICNIERDKGDWKGSVHSDTERRKEDHQIKYFQGQSITT